MTSDRAPRRRRRIWIAVGIVALAAVAAVLAFRPPDSEPLPDVLWIRGDSGALLEDGVGDAVRVGAADGAVLDHVRVGSSWSGPQGKGISFRRELTDEQRAKLRFAKMGFVPRFRIYGVGYDTTGKTVDRDGATWSEFRKFSDEFNYTQIGWWPW